MKKLLLEKGFVEYSHVMPFFVLFGVKKRKWVYKILDWLLDFMLTEFLHFNVIITVELRYSSQRWLFIFRTIEFRLKIMDPPNTLYDSAWWVFNLTNVWKVIRDVMHLIQAGFKNQLI